MSVERTLKIKSVSAHIYNYAIELGDKVELTDTELVEALANVIATASHRVNVDVRQRAVAVNAGIGSPVEKPNLLEHKHPVYFFGVWSEAQKGHFLYEKGGFSISEEKLPPDVRGKLDCGERFMPTPFDSRRPYQNTPQTLGIVKTQNIPGHQGGWEWTVMSMWDRSADHRGNCNASFLTCGVFTTEEMWRLAERDFPVQANSRV